MNTPAGWLLHCLSGDWTSLWAELESSLSVKVLGFLRHSYSKILYAMSQRCLLMFNNSASVVPQLHCRFQERGIIWCVTWKLRRKWFGWLCKAATDVTAAAQKDSLQPLGRELALLICDSAKETSGRADMPWTRLERGYTYALVPWAADSGVEGVYMGCVPAISLPSVEAGHLFVIGVRP